MRAAAIFAHEDRYRRVSAAPVTASAAASVQRRAARVEEAANG
jgi:hypothetical protein